MANLSASFDPTQIGVNQSTASDAASAASDAGSRAGYVGVDVAANADFLGAAFNDGVLRTGSGLSYVDGGDFVTLDVVDGGGGASGGGTITLFGQHINSVTQGTWIINSGASYPFWGFFFNSTHADQDEIHFSTFMGAGTYTCKFAASQNTDNGIAKIYIGGNLVATFDKYGATLHTKIYTQTGITVNTAGVKDIKLIVDGKNVSSSNHYCLFSFLSFYRTV